MDWSKILLGITVDEFKLLYVIGISGAVIRFLFNLGYGIWWDPNTPFKFHFPSFIRGLSRIIASMGVMAIVVARFPELSDNLVDLSFKIPTRMAAGNEVIVNLTYGGAFIIGTGIDDISKRVMRASEKLIVKKKNGTAK